MSALESRFLGGDPGRRTVMGTRQNRVRNVGLSIVGVCGVAVMPFLPMWGLGFTLIAAAAVWVMTLETHTGTLWERYRAKRIWKQRVRMGLSEFAPVDQRPAELNAAFISGGSRERRAVAKEWNKYRDWPDGAEQMTWLLSRPRVPGIAWHAPTGEAPYLSVVFPLEGQIKGLQGDAVVNARSRSFGRLLSVIGASSALARRLQLITRVQPVDTAAHEAWVLEELDHDSSDELMASYADVVSRVRTGGGLRQRHYAVVRWPLDAAFVGRAARQGPGQVGWIKLMGQEIDSIFREMSAAGLGPGRALSAAQVAAVLRNQQLPSWPLDQVGDVDPARPWVASSESWSHVTNRGPGPDGVTEEWFHRTALVPIGEVETSARNALWMLPLLGPLPGQRVIRTLSVQLEGLPQRFARAQAREDLTSDLAELQSQREKGELVDDELGVGLGASRARVRDLRPGLGHQGLVWVMHVSVSAASLEDLSAACELMVEAASKSGITDLRWLDGQEAAAQASTWPLARGMEPVGRSAGMRLSALLAGKGGNDVIAVKSIEPEKAESAEEKPGRSLVPFRKRQEPEAREVSAEATGLIDVPEMRGPRVRTNGRKARTGWYAPVAVGASTTTRQGEILNPAVLAAPLDDEGMVIGRLKGASAAPVAHDPFTSYKKGIITSPGVVVLGDIGTGKSSLLKTVYLLRPMILRGRRIVVIDRKDQQGEGEYSETVRRHRGSLMQLRLGEGGSRLNPLDPDLGRYLGRSGQYRLVQAMAERANDGSSLDRWDRDALRVAHRETMRAAEADDRVPVLEDLIARLGRVNDIADWSDLSPAARERIHQAGVGVRALLNGTLADELAGLFDGPTSANVSLSKKLTAFDVSQLPLDGPATSMVMAWAHAWLLGRLRLDPGKGTNFLAEEGWDMLQGPIARQMNANQLLARGLGLSNVVALHNIAQMPDGSTARSLLKEPQTIHIYRQDREEDADACVRLYGLDPGSRELLSTLPAGSHLLKVGTRPEIAVEHVRSPLEVELTRTDGAMYLENIA